MGLSPLFVDRVLELIQTVNKQGITIFMVEQNAQSRAADRRLRLCAADRAHRAVRAGARAAARSAHPRRLSRRTGRMTNDPGPASLAELEARLRRDFELLVLPPAKDWLEPRTHPEYGAVLDVAVIGAGMSGPGGGLRAEMSRGPLAADLRPLARRLRGPVGDLRPHGDPALAAGTERAGARHFQSHRSAPGSRRNSASPHGRRSIASRACNGWTICAGTGASSTCRSRTRPSWSILAATANSSS